MNFFLVQVAQMIINAPWEDTEFHELTLANVPKGH